MDKCYKLAAGLKPKGRKAWAYKFLGSLKRKDWKHWDVAHEYLSMVDLWYSGRPDADLYKLWNSYKVRANLTEKINIRKHEAIKEKGGKRGVKGNVLRAVLG